MDAPANIPPGGREAQIPTGFPQGRPAGIHNASRRDAVRDAGARHRVASARRRNGGAASARGASATRARSVRCPYNRNPDTMSVIECP